MILHENCLPADDSHEISYPFLLFLKKQQNLEVLSAANCKGRFMGLFLTLHYCCVCVLTSNQQLRSYGDWATA